MAIESSELMFVPEKQVKSPGELLVDALIFGFLGFLWVLIKLVGVLLWFITGAYRGIALACRLAFSRSRSSATQPLIGRIAAADEQPAHR